MACPPSLISLNCTPKRATAGGLRQFSPRSPRRKGGPDGGDGGKAVTYGLSPTIIRPRSWIPRSSLSTATDGQHGTSKRKHGSQGKDQVVIVPVGTMVFSREGELLVDLNGPGDRWLPRGRTWGSGNNRFLSNNRRAPAFAEQGENGQENWFNLELKLQADVALIGFPNVESPR